MSDEQKAARQQPEQETNPEAGTYVLSKDTCVLDKAASGKESRRGVGKSGSWDVFERSLDFTPKCNVEGIQANE